MHVAEDVSAIAGGVPAVVCQLSKQLALHGVSVQVVHAMGDPGVLPPGVESFAFPPMVLGRRWSWGRGLRVGISQLSAPAGGIAPIFHLHGIWTAPHYFAVRNARSSSVPFVVTAHGMLEPWLWEQQGWRVRAKKQVYWTLLAYPALRSASVVHAITPLERQHLKALFPNNRIEVIPNAIDMDEVSEHGVVREERERLILFLGRIEPKKGVDVLLYAFSKAKIDPEWRVAIIGPVWTQSYQMKLERILAENNLTKRVSFVGPVFGEEKIRWLRKAWVMAVPSHSEVIGLVNLEAAAYRLPTITTHQTGLFDWESGGGLLIQPDVIEMKAALERACSWPESERMERGASSRGLVEQRYSWKAVLPMWMSLYESIRGRA